MFYIHLLPFSFFLFVVNLFENRVLKIPTHYIWFVCLLPFIEFSVYILYRHYLDLPSWHISEVGTIISVSQVRQFRCPASICKTSRAQARLGPRLQGHYLFTLFRFLLFLVQVRSLLTLCLPFLTLCHVASHILCPFRVFDKSRSFRDLEWLYLLLKLSFGIEYHSLGWSSP